MTSRQRIYLMTLWRDACRAQRWDPQDKERRHELYFNTLGVKKRFSQFTQGDFDRVKAVLMQLSGKLKGAIETDHPEEGIKRRLLWKIRTEQTQLLALYVSDPSAYIRQIIRDKFHLSVGLGDVEDLSGARVVPTRSSQEALSDAPSTASQLEQLMMTIARCIDQFRQQAGHTVKQMKDLARANVLRAEILRLAPEAMRREMAAYRFNQPEINLLDAGQLAQLLNAIRAENNRLRRTRTQPSMREIEAEMAHR